VSDDWFKRVANWTPGQWRTKFEELAARGPELATFFPPDNYRAYQLSNLWRRIRRRVLKRDAQTCLRCEGLASAVHHRRYTQAVLDGEDDSQLVSICDDCHRTVHYEATGRERNSWNEGEAILLEKPPTTSTTRQFMVDAYRRGLAGAKLPR